MRSLTSLQHCSIFTGILALAILSCSGAANVSNLFATDTPTPTSTFTPSPTLTPSPTSTPTQTPSPTSTPVPSGVKMEEQADGTTLFSDYDNKYQLALPENWIILPLSSEDMADILKKMAEEEPELEEIAAAFTQLDPDVIRVMAVNRDNKYITNGFSTNLSVTAIEDKLMASMPLDFVTGAMEESLKQEGAELISSENLAAKNPNGVEVADFDFVQSIFSATGNKVQVRSRIVIFQAGGKLFLIQLATPKQFGEELLPVLDHIKDTIKLLEL